MIVTSFTLRSPCTWKLQCEMYVLQFYLNLFSVALAQLRLTLRCRCIDASTSTPPHLSTLASSYIFTRSRPQIYLSTSPHPHICTSISHLYIHTVAPSHLSCLSFGNRHARPVVTLSRFCFSSSRALSVLVEFHLLPDPQAVIARWACGNRNRISTHVNNFARPLESAVSC